MYIVKHTTLDGEEFYNGPFAAKEQAYTYASDMADDFLKSLGNSAKRWTLDADGDTTVDVHRRDDESTAEVWEVFTLIGVTP